ncbi:MAG: NAD(P)-dependent oxidoreductase [bacterium]
MTAPSPHARPKTCLVTGATGFMGSHLVECLRAAGHEVRATDLDPPTPEDDPVRGRYPGLLRRLQVEFIPADLNETGAWESLLAGIDWVFHVAGLFDYSAPRERLFRVNVEGTRRLLEAMRKNGKVQRLILWGAGGIYGRPRAEDLPLREDSPPRPPNAYLQSKWRQEELAREYFRNAGLAYTCLRPTGVYGPRASYGMGRMLLQMAGMKKIRIPRNFRGRMPLVHARDVCAAALFLAPLEAARGEAYHLADDRPYSNVEFFRMVASLLNKPFAELPPLPPALLRGLASIGATLENFFAKRIAHRRPNLERDTLFMLGADFWYSNEKLKALGFRFQYPDSRPGIEETLQWYREQGLLPDPKGGESDISHR